MKILRFVGVMVIALCLSVPCFAAEYYCGVVGGQVVDGPFDILRKKSYQGVSVPYALSNDQRISKGWLPYINTKPIYNTDTQYLTSEKVVSEDSVIETYVVHDYTAEEMTARIATAKAAKVETLKSIARQKAILNSKWTKDHEAAIGLLETLPAIRDHELTAPDMDTVVSNALAAIAASGIADMTYTQIDTIVDNATADPSLKVVLKKAFKLLLAITKIQMGAE